MTPVHGKHRGRLFNCAEGETFPAGTKWFRMLVRASRGCSSLTALRGEGVGRSAAWPRRLRGQNKSVIRESSNRFSEKVMRKT